MNQLQIIGNLTRDAEVRQSERTQENFLTFSVAVNQGKDAQGNDREALFVSIRQKQYQNTPNGLLPYLTKGKKVFVQGRVSLSVYQSKTNGAWLPELTCWAEKIELCGGGEQQAQPTQPIQQGGYQAAPQAAQVPTGGGVYYPNQSGVQYNGIGQPYSTQPAPQPMQVEQESGNLPF